jgi:hypothetical protein
MNGRYLQQCRSVIVTHPLRYIQHFHHLMDSDMASPNQNIVEVPLPLTVNLPDVMAYLVDPANEERMVQIANNSWNTLRERYLTPAAK